MSQQINKMLVNSQNDGIPDAAQYILEKVFYCENILEQIFKFLPVNDLLTSRIVCRKWKLESDRLLKSRQILILLTTEEDINTLAALMDKQKALGSTIIFNKFIIQFVQLHLEQDVVRRFLDSHGSSFQHLGLQFSWSLERTKNTSSSFKYLLEKQVSNIKSLEFFGFSEDLWQAGNLFNDSTNLLPSLKYIGCFSVRDYRHAEECPLYLSLFSHLSRVKKIAINCSNYWNILLDCASSNKDNRLLKILSDVEEISMVFPELLISPQIAKYKKISERLGKQHCGLIKPSNYKIFDLMPQVCPNVRMLRVCFSNFALLPKANVGNLLTKYANQLEELWMNVYYEEHTPLPILKTWGENGYQNEQQHEREEQVDADVINEFFSTVVFQKLRIIRTGIDIFSPTSTVTRLFDKQLPKLEVLMLNCNLVRIPKLVWNYKFNNTSLQTLELHSSGYNLNAERLILVGQVFSNIKFLRTMVPNDTALRVIIEAFPNLEELTICGLFTDVGVMAIGDLKRLRNLRIEANLTEHSINYLMQLKSIIFLHVNK